MRSHAASPGDLSLFNEYIEVVLSDTGEFSIGTKSGDPERASDDNKVLLFGHPSPETSDTMVRIDGSDYGFGSSGTNITASQLSNGVLICAWRVANNVDVTQSLSIVKSKGTLYKDTIEIKYNVKNNDTVNHNVALRIQLDTMLGDNDGAPFRVVSVGKVTTDTEFTNVIPQFIHVFDDLANPSVFAMLTLADISYRTPDKVVLGYWPESVGSWDYPIVAGRSFLDNDNDGTISGRSPDSDSSIITWWGYPDSKIIVLSPGQSVDLVELYGLGGMTFIPWYPFNIGIASPSELELLSSGSGYKYSPDPFIVTVYLENSSASPVTNATVTLNLPPEMFLAPGETLTKNVPNVNVGDGAQLSWNVKTYGKYNFKRWFSATVNANGSSKTGSRAIYVPGRAGSVFGQLTNAANIPIANATVELWTNSLVRTLTTGADGTYLFANLASGNYQIRAVASGYPSVTIPATANSDNYSSFSANPILSAVLQTKLETYPYPNPVREGDVHIRFYLEEVKDVKIKFFSPDGELIETKSVSGNKTGWNETNWNVEGLANGLYLYLLESDSETARNKIAVIKWQR
ncbi:MAG: carboxypeptidase regulatory-like domain-containing protein [Elusimicrobiota bacterium]